MAKDLILTSVTNCLAAEFDVHDVDVASAGPIWGPSASGDRSIEPGGTGSDRLPACFTDRFFSARCCVVAFLGYWSGS
jgi:hypothetical protein